MKKGNGVGVNPWFHEGSKGKDKCIVYANFDNQYASLPESKQGRVFAYDVRLAMDYSGLVIKLDCILWLHIKHFFVTVLLLYLKHL